MSSTNRGAEKKPNEFYKTPAGIVELLLNNYRGIRDGMIILDPCAGSGTIARTLKKKYPDVRVDQVDIVDHNKPYSPLYEVGLGEVYCKDFLLLNIDFRKYDAFIFNPPFSLAEKIVSKCLSVRRNINIPVIALQRLGFLESNKRFRFWNSIDLNKLYVLSRRPSFTEDGNTDSAGYAWFIWDGGEKDIRVLRED